MKMKKIGEKYYIGSWASDVELSPKISEEEEAKRRPEAVINRTIKEAEAAERIGSEEAPFLWEKASSYLEKYL